MCWSYPCPSNKHITLDLNGKTIDRALNSPVLLGLVIHVDGGNLTVSDSSDSATGRITGGKNGNYAMGGLNGGGVTVLTNLESDPWGGNLTLEGGSITGNSANGNGGGVYVDSGSTFTMSGGSITGNNAGDNGGGVYVGSGSNTMSGGSITMSGGSITGNNATDNGGGVYVGTNGTAFKVSGTVQIMNNVKGGTQNGNTHMYTGDTANNVYFEINEHRANPITVTGSLNDSASIGISEGQGALIPITVAQGNESHIDISGDAAKFFGDVSYRGTYFDTNDGTIKLGVAYVVTYAPGANGTGTYAATKEINGVSLTLPGAVFTRSGYTQTGWATTDGGDKVYNLGESYINNAPVTLYPVWTVSSTGSSVPTVSLPASGDVPVSAKISGSTAKVEVPQAKLETVLKGGETNVTVDLSGKTGVKDIELPAKTLQTIGEAGASVTVKTENGSVTLDAATLKGLSDAADGKAVTLSIAPIDIKILSKSEQGMVGERPALTLSAAIGAETVTNFDGSVTVIVPYKKAADEKAEGLCVWFLNGGKITKMPASYDAKTNTMAFTTPHFSTYVIGYFPFEDVADNAWYYGDAAYAYINSLFSGTTETEFSPETPMTRAMLWTVLARFAGINTAQSTNINYYDAAQKWAMENGITDGTAPNGEITREQLVTILCRYAKLQKLDTTGGMAVREYDDYESISDYAKEAMSWAVSSGLVQGCENTLMPQGGATRAQVAAILHRFAANTES